MKRTYRLLLLILSLLIVSGGCGGSDTYKIALLLPGESFTRFEEADRRAFENVVADLCAECEVLYSDANGKHNTQKRQAENALKQGADVLVLYPVEPNYATRIVEKASAQDIPVLNYESLIAVAEPDVLLAYDNVKTGELQVEALSESLKEEGNSKGPIVVLNGEPGNSEQHEFKKGAHDELAAARFEIALEFFTPFWLPSEAQREMRQAIRKLGPNGFAGVYAETDGIAEGAIAAMRSAGIDPTARPPTGRDATIRGLRRILRGTQSMTTYEPIEPEISLSAEIAMELAEGNGVSQDKITRTVTAPAAKAPGVLLEPIVVTKDNIKQTVIADGYVSASKLCAGSFRPDCEAAGILAPRK